jgi:hypothetical protein
METATNWERVSYNSPLGQSTELRKEQEFAKIMDESSQVEPVPFLTRICLADSLQVI